MNPFLKSLLTLVIGGAAAGADTALSHVVPTGGLAATLSASPAIAAVFAGALLAAHNVLTRLEAQAGIHPAQTGGN